MGKDLWPAILQMPHEATPGELAQQEIAKKERDFAAEKMANNGLSGWGNVESAVKDLLGVADGRGAQFDKRVDEYMTKQRDDIEASLSATTSAMVPDASYSLMMKKEEMIIDTPQGLMTGGDGVRRTTEEELGRINNWLSSHQGAVGSRALEGMSDEELRFLKIKAEEEIRLQDAQEWEAKLQAEKDAYQAQKRFAARIEANEAHKRVTMALGGTKALAGTSELAKRSQVRVPFKASETQEKTEQNTPVPTFNPAVSRTKNIGNISFL